jgi:hypothetical protein
MRHPSGYTDIDARRGASPWRSGLTPPGVKMMSTNQPSGASGASTAAEVVEAHVTVPPIPTVSDASAQQKSAQARVRHTTGERP